MTAQREEWRRLADAASEGPWETDVDPSIRGLTAVAKRYTTGSISHVSQRSNIPDAAFIAAAREAVPFLLAQLDEAEVREGELRAALTWALSWCPDDEDFLKHGDTFQREQLAVARAALAKGKP